MLQRLKTRWNEASTKERIAIVGAPVLAGFLTALFSGTEPKPLSRDAFLKGCMKSNPLGLPANVLQSYCECNAEGISPTMLAAARTDTSQLTPEITRLAETCARKTGIAVAE